MGWKIYLIAITNAANVNVADVPHKLGLDNLRPAKEMSMHKAQYENGISIGKHGDIIFIVSSELVFRFYDKAPSDFELKLCAEFPSSEIAVITVNQTSDLYGYSIIRNGKRQRVKSGADLELFVDYGEMIPEEIDISKEKLFDDEELKEMKEDYSKDELEKVIAQEISFRTTFRLTKRYFGREFDHVGSDYERITVIRFE
jgi:hypothetical protein